MVTNATASQKKKSTSTKRKTVAKATVPKKKSTAVKKPTASQKVDYYPNRMTLAVSVLAGTLLVLFALIAVLGSQ